MMKDKKVVDWLRKYSYCIKQEHTKLNKFLSVIILLLLYTYLASFYSNYIWTVFESQSGIFGDMFGAFNAYFSGLGFLAVAYTIYQQHKQIKGNSEIIKEQSILLAMQLEVALHSLKKELGDEVIQNDLVELLNEIKRKKKKLSQS